ncbi:MAG: universal stress protein [Gammaproteobacteria bacterium]
MFKRILIPTDFGPPSARAVALGVEIARRFDAAVTLLHTYEIPAYAYEGMAYASGDLLTAVENAATAELKTALEGVQKTLPAANSMLRRGVAWEEILAAGKEVSADLIVMGTHGRRGISHALLGSVAEKVVRMSPIPVLTVRSTD